MGLGSDGAGLAARAGLMLAPVTSLGCENRAVLLRSGGDGIKRV